MPRRYLPQWQFAQPLRYGYQAGCGFAQTDSCAASPLPASLAGYYCTPGQGSAVFTLTLPSGGAGPSSVLSNTCTADSAAVRGWSWGLELGGWSWGQGAPGAHWG